MKKSNNNISDWLDKFGDPEIDKKVEMELEKITKGIYYKFIDEAYKFFKNSFPIKKSNPANDYVNENAQLLTQEEFINKIKTDNEFAKKWGLKITERELTLEERYNKWFNNNYETGMERYFNPNNPPDFDNEYYHPTPTKLITLTYNNETIQYHE